MKKYSLNDTLKKSKPSKYKEKIEEARNDTRHGIHFICKTLGMNVDQYWCDEVCKRCKKDDENLLINVLFKDDDPDILDFDTSVFDI